MTEHVPTVAELEHRGLAHRDAGSKGGVARFHVTDEGHRLMGEALRANGRAARADEAR